MMKMMMMMEDDEDYKRPNFTALQYPRWTYFTGNWEDKGENKPLHYAIFILFILQRK